MTEWGVLEVKRSLSRFEKDNKEIDTTEIDYYN